MREVQTFAFILTLEGVTILGLTFSLLTVMMRGPEVRWLCPGHTVARPLRINWRI